MGDIVAGAFAYERIADIRSATLEPSITVLTAGFVPSMSLTRIEPGPVGVKVMSRPIGGLPVEMVSDPNFGVMAGMVTLLVFGEAPEASSSGSRSIGAGASVVSSGNGTHRHVRWPLAPIGAGSLWGWVRCTARVPCHAAPSGTGAARENVRRVIRLVVSVALVAAIVAGVVWWSWVVAQVRAVVVLSRVLDVPVLDAAVVRVTSEPVVSETTIAGAPTTVVHPEGGGPWPAVLFITGADAGGRDEPHVRALADGLARAGFVTYVPDLPGMRSGTITAGTVDSAVDVTVGVARRGETSDGRVMLASVSAGASLALVVAASPETTGSVSAVAGVAPFTDMRRVVMLATTGYYRHDDGRLQRYDAAPWMREALALSLLDALRRGSTPPAVVDALAERVGEEEEDPLAPFAEVPTSLLDHDARAVVSLLANRDPDRFDSLFAALPEPLRREVEQLSPISGAGRLTMPVELASAPHDRYFPLAESRALVEAAPLARLTVTSTLEHATPSLDAGTVRDLARFDAFLVRVLRDADRER